MRLDESYRLLDLDPRATDEEVRRAYRDLTKVWHPDRFGHDAALRRKAEEKLKAINEAYETIRAAQPSHSSPPRSAATSAPEEAPRRPRRSHNVTYALTCALFALFILLRRPTPAGLVIAMVLFILAGVFVARLRKVGR